MKIRIKRILAGKFKGQYRFEIVAKNGELIDPRQKYDRKAGVEKAARLLMSSMWEEIEYVVPAKKKPRKLKVNKPKL